MWLKGARDGAGMVVSLFCGTRYAFRMWQLLNPGVTYHRWKFLAMNERRARALFNTGSILAVILLCANSHRVAFGRGCNLGDDWNRRIVG